MTEQLFEKDIVISARPRKRAICVSQFSWSIVTSLARKMGLNRGSTMDFIINDWLSNHPSIQKALKTNDPIDPFWDLIKLHERGE